MKSELLQHLNGNNIGRFPVWAMRQAGRFLPSYRAIREKHSFWEMVTTPKLAAEVSLLPVHELPVDGIIFFSDILTLPYGMGIEIEMRESVGPVTLNPLRDEEAFKRFSAFSASRDTKFVGDALRLIREAMPDEKTLLGFAGAPWTVACYLVEGKPKKGFDGIKGWMYRDPQSLARALRLLAGATVQYLKYQVESGAQVIQLFDTWISEMPKSFFDEYYRPILNEIFDAIKGVPRIYFAKRSHHVLSSFSELRVDVLSVDELLKLSEVETITQKCFSLQGNLDPVMLFSDEATVRRETRKIVLEAQKLSKPAVMNLGHGVLPGTPVQNVRAFMEEARVKWI